MSAETVAGLFFEVKRELDEWKGANPHVPDHSPGTGNGGARQRHQAGRSGLDPDN
jgi:hypothetical protein